MRRTASSSGGGPPGGARSPQIPHTIALGERYAVVSCHVERPLDDRVWGRFARLQAARPEGFRVTAFMRPPDPDAGEDRERWLERARAAAVHGPLGHHSHFGGPSQARPAPGPSQGMSASARVRREAGWLRAAGLAPRFFCGGGWYLDGEVAAALADLGYADCTATAFPLRYLEAGKPRASVSAPAWLRLGDGRRLLELPATHTLGAAVRAALRPGGLSAPLVHVHFHDWELLDPRRRAALRLVLGLLARRRRPAGLDEAADAAAAAAPEVPFSEAAGAR